MTDGLGMLKKLLDFYAAPFASSQQVPDAASAQIYLNKLGDMKNGHHYLEAYADLILHHITTLEGNVRQMNERVQSKLLWDVVRCLIV